MKYAESPALDSVYALVAELYEYRRGRSDQPERAMAIAAALIELGEDRSWASVWWAYGAIHHDLSDSSYKKALDLLARVDHSDEARAAALMLRAEIKSTQALEQGEVSSPAEQLALLEEAAVLVPHWPELRVRLAHACKVAGDDNRSQAHATRALSLLESQQPTDDPFDSAISGRNLDRAYVTQELNALR